jgi:hypothetical protein
MAWNKIKSMFVVSEGSVSAAPSDVDHTLQTLKDLEKYELPPGEVAPLPAGTSPAALSGQIDFQALYDQAGIPNTDEVEALERFLGGLDENMPESSKTAAAKAFLGAIGKSPQDVLTDAGRKIAVVRAVADAKRADTDQGVGARQGTIAELQRQIDEQRAAIEALQKDLESVRSQCTVEESRLQGARMFFGYVGEAAVPGAR